MLVARGWWANSGAAQLSQNEGLRADASHTQQGMSSSVGKSLRRATSVRHAALPSSCRRDCSSLAPQKLRPRQHQFGQEFFGSGDSRRTRSGVFRSGSSTGEAKETEEKAKESSSGNTTTVTVSSSDDEREEEQAQVTQSGSDVSKGDESRGVIASSNDVSSTASGTPKPPNPKQEASPQSPTAQFQSFIISDLLMPEKVDPGDVKTFRDKFCGIKTYFVTGQEPFGDTGEGVILKGNMRGAKETVYAELKTGMGSLFGNKYELLMVEEPSGFGVDPVSQGDRRDVRVSLVMVRRESVNLDAPGAWQYVIALLLLGVTAGACLELGLATQVSKVPPEIIKYFTAPVPEGDPPTLEALAPFVRDALPVAYGVLGIQLFHEIGHYLMAKQRRVRLGIPFLIPNITIGSFGSITQFLSPCPDRTAKFDVATAGPVAGATLSFAMFLTGLALTVSATADPIAIAGSTSAAIQDLVSGDLVRVPSLLFQGSLLLGFISSAVLGSDAMHAATVSIHPLVITGWCGLTVSALNMLPVGSLDGGRAMQAAFGPSATRVAGIATYVSLALGLVGGTLSLPFVLYVLLLQRNLEKPALNDVTGISQGRKIGLAVLLGLTLLILLPALDILADIGGMDSSNALIGL